MGTVIERKPSSVNSSIGKESTMGQSTVNLSERWSALQNILKSIRKMLQHLVVKYLLEKK